MHADRGHPVDDADMEAILDVPGPVLTETVVAADWEVDRGGVLDLEAAEARRMGILPGPEPIELFLHAIVHPKRGTYLIDTGVGAAFGASSAPEELGAVYPRMMHTDRFRLRTATATWLARHPSPSGVLLTHLHIDHLMGARDIPRDVPFFVGAGEPEERSRNAWVTAPIVDRELAGRAPLAQLSFDGNRRGALAGVRDLFGDATVWAIAVPGHTAGSVAYAMRSARGPVLFVGDACHTRWGWEHGVASGMYASDRALAKASLEQLRELSRRHPNLEIRLGHQDR